MVHEFFSNNSAPWFESLFLFPHEIGAAYLLHLVRSHAFIEGNKRDAAACAILFFKINRLPYSITEEEAVELTLAAGSGQMDRAAITAFFRKHLRIPDSLTFRAGHPVVDAGSQSAVDQRNKSTEETG
jgi:hypothetical protein